MKTHILGYPRMGAQRELKFALEKYWQGATDAESLQQAAQGLRQKNHQQQAQKLSMITAGDFVLYDQMLSHMLWLGVAPSRFGFGAVGLPEYFAMARGNDAQPALEMTKWWDTNYHYLVPELDDKVSFNGDVDAYSALIEEALLQSPAVKPVLIGPISFLYLSKCSDGNRLQYLTKILPAYACLLARLQTLKIDWVQIDEPVLALELDAHWLQAFHQAYDFLAPLSPKILLATYFDDVSDQTQTLLSLPIAGLHIDVVRAPEQLAFWQKILPSHWVLSVGIVDGRNIWCSDLRQQLMQLQPIHAQLGERLWLAPSCSLLHVPQSLRPETQLDPQQLAWLAFADEKIDELQTLSLGLQQGEAAITQQLLISDAVVANRLASAQSNAVRARVATLTSASSQRLSPFANRNEQQRAHLKLPLLPTTTIGSFPQTPEIRRVRSAYKKQEISAQAYAEAMRVEIAQAIAKQESYGLDVLVHGEAERNDMVEYFGEQLKGFLFTQNGWVQSYGSRCVKPPIIFGDVERPNAMTLEWTRYAQSLTKKPVKGMLTGPITILQWSFVRNDQPRAQTALQIALALRDEVCDLEAAGVSIIQIDEPALREGLPLKRSQWISYLQWAVEAFKVASCGVKDSTQIHTHMCYAEFSDILPAIAGLDADVITIETSRSAMQILQSFTDFRYPNDIGPGVYDIHSPRIPSVLEMLQLLQKAAWVVPLERLWVNPDCGLKTRIWQEVDQALVNMVQAANELRAQWAIVS